MKGYIDIRFTYEIPDDEEDRQRIYGTTDLLECVKIDAANSVEDLVSYSEAEVVAISVGQRMVRGAP